MNKNIMLRFGSIIVCALVSMITGCGMFLHYQVRTDFSPFTHTQMGMFISALMMVVLSGIWNSPELVKK